MKSKGFLSLIIFGFVSLVSVSIINAVDASPAVEPKEYDTGPGGNVECSEVGDYENSSQRFDYGDQYSGNVGPFTWTTSNNRYVSWSGNHDGMAVILKGGNSANVYKYNSSYSQDNGLRSPLNKGEQIPELSNLTFCWDSKEDEQVSQPDVDPIFECWEEDYNNEGKYIAYFGWENHGDEAVEIPFGSGNTVTPNSYESFFPENFGVPNNGPRTGRTPFFPNAAITIPKWDGSEIVWGLEGHGTETASLNGPKCESIDVCPNLEGDQRVLLDGYFIIDGVCMTEGNGGIEPTPTPTPTEEPDQVLGDLHLNEIVCENYEVKGRYEAERNGEPAEDVPVTFRYNNEEETINTDSNGIANVLFNWAGEQTLYADASNGFPDRRTEVTEPECDPAVGGVLGTSTEEPAAPEGQVLGATSYADTGTFSDVFAAMLGLEGIISTTVGTYLYGRKKAKK